MRNDVKLGFAIGGVLLAVLIVYVLVVPGSAKPKQARVDNTKKTDAGKVTLEPLAPATQPAPPPAAPSAEYTPMAVAPAATQPAPQIAQGDEAVAAVTDNAAQVVDPPAPKKAKDIDWAKLLNGQTLIAETPVPADHSRATAIEPASEPKVTPAPETPLAEQAKPAAPEQPATPPVAEPQSSNEIVRHPGGGVSIYPPPEAISPEKPELKPSTQPSGLASARTHRVTASETLSSISAAAYGTDKYWPLIVKANPNLDPNRMKVGQIINLPDVQALKPADPQSASAKVGPAHAAAVAIDGTKQYRVQSGDSLHKISVKLYGKSTVADRIYDLNKQAIGADPARLKVGQILTLPEPPTVTASTR